jgi:hypothetical protein
MSTAYAPTGYVRQRGLDDYASHPTGLPEARPMPIMRGKVVEVRQVENTVDVTLTDGTRLTHVPLASPFAGTAYGSYRTPRITNLLPDRDAQGSLDGFAGTGVADHYVLVGFIGGDNPYQTNALQPIVITSVQPQVNQQTNSAISWSDRSPNSAYIHLVTDDGHDVTYGPDFTGVVRGPDPTRWYPQAHDPGMQGPPDFDGLWQVTNPGGAHAFMALRCQGSDTTLFLHPDGRTTLMRNDGKGNLMASVEIHANGDLSSTTIGNHTVTAQSVTLNAATVHINGDLQVTGAIVAGDVQAQTGSVPGPYGPGTNATPQGGTVVMHDLSLISPPDNPHT